MHTATLACATRNPRPTHLYGPDDCDAGAVDARRAVLYFRPFVSSAMVADGQHRGRRDASSIADEAEALAQTLAPVGPLVALGRPGAALPERGVLRMCVDHEAWQRTVRHWLAHAKLVVLRAGTSGPDFRWELGEAATLVAPDRLVLLIPQNRHDYNRFRQCVTNIFSAGLPDYADLPLQRLRTRGVNGIIHFDRERTARFVRVERPFLLAGGLRQEQAAALARACEPIVATLAAAPAQHELRLLRLGTSIVR